MMTILTGSARFLVGHTGYAVAMALVFFAGMTFAVPVLRWQVGFLLLLPRWFAGRIERIMSSGPSFPGLGAFIFLFNSGMMLLDMLTGLVPWLPAFVTFLTGLNVALAGFMGRSGAGPERVADPLPFSARLCAALTFCLELPCFWYTMAMGWTMTARFVDVFRGGNMGSVRQRVVAYVIVILPLLAVSAFAEAHAVRSALQRRPRD